MNRNLKIIMGYGGKYCAGDDGHIYCYSTAKTNARKKQPFQLKEQMFKGGYPFIQILHNGIKKSMMLHTTICAAFHGEKKKRGLCVRHLDGNKLNSKPDNLCWGTYSENEADKRRHGTAAIGEKQGSAKLTDEGVRIIRASIPFGLWDVENASKVFKVHPSTIRRIAEGRDWKHVK